MMKQLLYHHPLIHHHYPPSTTTVDAGSLTQLPAAQPAAAWAHAWLVRPIATCGSTFSATPGGTPGVGPFACENLASPGFKHLRLDCPIRAIHFCCVATRWRHHLKKMAGNSWFPPVELGFLEILPAFLEDLPRWEPKPLICTATRQRRVKHQQALNNQPSVAHILKLQRFAQPRDKRSFGRWRI